MLARIRNLVMSVDRRVLLSGVVTVAKALIPRIMRERGRDQQMAIEAIEAIAVATDWATKIQRGIATHEDFVAVKKEFCEAVDVAESRLL